MFFSNSFSLWRFVDNSIWSSPRRFHSKLPVKIRLRREGPFLGSKSPNRSPWVTRSFSRRLCWCCWCARLATYPPATLPFRPAGSSCARRSTARTRTGDLQPPRGGAGVFLSVGGPTDHTQPVGAGKAAQRGSRRNRGGRRRLRRAEGKMPPEMRAGGVGDQDVRTAAEDRAPRY